MTPTILPTRIPEALPVEVEPPRIHHVAPPPGVEVASEEGGGFRPLAALRYRWPTVVFLGSLLAAALALVAYSVIPAKYTTYSIVRVAPQDPRIYYHEDPQGRSDFASYLKTQAGMLRSHFVLTAALRNPEVAALPMLRSQVDPVRFLEEELIVEFSDGSELIRPKLQGDDPRAIMMIVNAVHDAYFQEVVEAERKRKQARLRQIEDAIAQMQQELERKLPPPMVQGDRPAESLPGVGPNLAASQITRLREKLDGIEVRQKQLEEEKQRLARRREDPAAEVPPPPAALLAQIEADPAITAVQRQIALWQKQKKYLIDLSGDPAHPAVRDLTSRITEANAERERIRQTRLEEYQRSQLDETVKRLRREEERVAAELSNLAILHEQTSAELRDYEARLAKILPEGEAPRDFTKVDVRTRAEIISGMMEKASLLRLELSAPSRVQSVQRASTPMKRDVRKQWLGTAAAALGGFLLIGAAVIAHEARVRRVMSVAELPSSSLGPVLGAIPALPDDPAAARPADLVLAEETIEKARVNLLQQFGSAGGKVVVVTSAIGDEGRTFLAREWALSFARSGCLTLLVDFDLRHPIVHEMFGEDHERGMCELLTGEADLPTCARILPHGISFVPAGRWGDVVRQYLSAARVAEVLAELRARFDVVILHCHPILAVADTSLASRAADAVVLSVEKYQSRIPFVRRAQERITSLHPEAFGLVVLNANRDECLT